MDGMRSADADAAKTFLLAHLPHIRICLDTILRGEGFCTVQDGQWNKAQLKGLEKGYVYEIVYTAADFSGKIVVKRFFVELK